jgi:hypothetical protein
MNLTVLAEAKKAEKERQAAARKAEEEEEAKNRRDSGRRCAIM